jgi:hypothetical protein
MVIHGTEGLSPDTISAEVDQGGKFVVYEYCISVLILTLRLRSGIYFIGPRESGVGQRIAYACLSFFLGWWGFPWGPIYTISSIATNLGGGLDVTEETARALGLRAGHTHGGIDAAGIARLLRKDRPET